MDLFAFFKLVAKIKNKRPSNLPIQHGNGSSSCRNVESNAAVIRNRKGLSPRVPMCGRRGNLGTHPCLRDLNVTSSNSSTQEAIAWGAVDGVSSFHLSSLPLAPTQETCFDIVGQLRHVQNQRLDISEHRAQGLGCFFQPVDQNFF